MGKILFLGQFLFYFVCVQASDVNVANYYSLERANLDLNLEISELEMEPIMNKLSEHKPGVSQHWKLPRNCAEASYGKTGIYTIEIPYTKFGPFTVACDAEFHNADWLVIQRRMDGSVDFFRPWAEYKQGFGDVEGEFFIGLDKLHYLTSYKPHELLIVMEDFDNVTKYAKYDDFAIGNEAESYNLKRLGKYNGTAGDSLDYHKSQKFSTYDNDNDGSDDNWASRRVGAWWYKSGSYSNLNGLYLKGKYEAPHEYGANWYYFKDNDYYSLKFIQMMIRPKSGYYN